MKTSLFNCDVCGAMCEADKDSIRPTNPDWFYIAIAPYDVEGNVLKLPSVRVDACSNKCAEAMLRKMADRIAEMRRQREGGA